MDVAAETFTSKVERLKLQILTEKDTSATAQSIAEDVSRLPDFVYEDQQSAVLARLCLSPQLQHASPKELDSVIDTLADQMKNRREKPNAFITLDLPDFIEKRRDSLDFVYLKKTDVFTVPLTFKLSVENILNDNYLTTVGDETQEDYRTGVSAALGVSYAY